LIAITDKVRIRIKILTVKNWHDAAKVFVDTVGPVDIVEHRYIGLGDIVPIYCGLILGFF
jgi:hypothetical protein